MSRDSMSPAEARAALDNVGMTRAQMAALGNCPPWRHAAFGAVMALLVSGIGFDTTIQAACTAVALSGVAIIASYDRKRYGVFVNGFRRGATLPFTIALLLAMLGLMIAQMWLRDRHAPDAIHLGIGVAGFLIGTGASVIWSRIFRREMERRG